MNITRRSAVRFFIATAAGIVPGISAVLAHAQGSQVTMLVGFAPGGPLDVLTRAISDKLRLLWNRPVVVMNPAGAAGQLAVRALKRGPADGSVLMASTFAVPVMNPTVYNLSDQISGVDYLPVAQWATFGYALVVPASHPAKDIRSLIAWIHEKPDERAVFGVSSLGNLPHFLGLNLAEKLKLPLRAIGYKGGAPMMIDLISGTIPMAISGEMDFVQQENAGKVRTLATFGHERSSVFPKVPTVREVDLDINANGWYALFAPSGTPKQVIDRIAEDVSKVIEDPSLNERIRKLGFTPTPGVGADALGQIIAENRKTWEPLIRKSGFKPT